MKKLSKTFFERPVLEVAPDLLGKMLTVKTPKGKIQRLVITEVEAYDGEDDLACHASRGRTPRSEGLYREAGVFYIYLIYGMYNMLNIVTDEKGYPAAVLIRGVEGISGPGRLTRDLGITGAIHGQPAKPKTGVWFEESEVVVPKEKIKATPRVGVAYAGEWARKPYRFIRK